MTTLSHTPILSRKLASGFTLIELMIVVAIIGILAGIAYPSYIDSVRKGKRADGRAALTSLLQQQERYLTQNNTYATFPIGNVPANLPFRDYSATDGVKASSNYLLGARACQPLTAGGAAPNVRDCIEVFAQPQTDIFTDPGVTMLAIDTLGRRRCTGSDQAHCWK
jgi:type IV pilus assembly protein PilE